MTYGEVESFINWLVKNPWWNSMKYDIYLLLKKEFETEVKK